MGAQVFLFEGFELSPQQRRLVRDGRSIRIGSRAFDILVVLAANAGSIVSKEQLILSVWPQTYVDENSLRVHMSQLRRALNQAAAGRSIIVNIPGRGYSFVAELEGSPRGASTFLAPAAAAPDPTLSGHNPGTMLEQLRLTGAEQRPDGKIAPDLAQLAVDERIADALSSAMAMLRDGQGEGEVPAGRRATLLALLAII